MIDRSIKICNNWNSFYNDVENIKFNLIKNAYQPFLINKVIKRYLDYKFSSNQNQLKDKSDIHYFKLPYIGNLSHHIKYKISKLCKEFCEEHLNIKLVFKGIVKWAEPCKCVILLVSRIHWHKRINSSLKEWRFWYLILTGHFLP